MLFHMWLLGKGCLLTFLIRHGLGAEKVYLGVGEHVAHVASRLSTVLGSGVERCSVLGVEGEFTFTSGLFFADDRFARLDAISNVEQLCRNQAHLSLIASIPAFACTR